MKSLSLPLHGILLASLIAVMGFSAGCGVIRRSPETHFYVLTLPEGSPTPSTRPHVQGPQVGIGPVTLPGYLDRTNIFMRAGSSPDVQLAEYDRWGEPLGEGVTRLLVESLSARLDAIDGMAVALRANMPLDWRISLDIARFDGAPGQDVVLDAAWSLTTANGESVREGLFVQRITAGPSIDDLVRSHGTLLEELARVLHQAIIDSRKKNK